MYSTHIWYQFVIHGRKITALLGLVFVVFLGSINTSHAQQNLLKHDKKRIHFGMTLGFNRAQFMVRHAPAFTYHDTIKVVESPISTGFNVGIISDLHLGNNADLRFIPTLIFAEKRLNYVETLDEGDTETQKTVESIILGFPLTFKYKSDRFFDNMRVYILGGGRFDWDLASNSKARRATDIVKIDRFDFSAEYGVGLEFYFPLFIFSPEIKITQGLTNLLVPTPNFRYSDVLGKLRSRYLTLSLQFEG